ncbi:hypothetical protein FPV67DRAFT_1081966 [Lyophyllum atratum]|nr:hypothetical protein FPV67DRAFT_1081966 [Lyophyllum atratum]
MPLRPGERCEHCHKHVHPQSKLLSKDDITVHPPPACDACLSPNDTLKTCSSCKLVRYCGRDCQRAHWPAHKKFCKVNVDLRKDAKELGEVVQAKQASFARWCEDNHQQFAHAALHALGIHSPLDRERLQNYAFLIIIQTRDVTAVGAKKFKFVHSILKASQVSMTEMHLRYAWRFVRGDTTLPSPALDLYTVPMEVGDEDLPRSYDPLWLATLKEEVQQ